MAFSGLHVPRHVRRLFSRAVDTLSMPTRSVSKSSRGFWPEFAATRRKTLMSLWGFALKAQQNFPGFTGDDHPWPVLR